MQDQKPCTRWDLRAAAESVITCLVEEGGDVYVRGWTGDEPDITGVCQYYCANCLTDFVPDGLDNHDVDHAWQEALDHLAKQETTK